MKKTIYYIIAGAALIATSVACNVMDLKPTTKVGIEDLLSTPDGVRANMANLYGRLPIEDFCFNPEGYSLGLTNCNGHHSDMMTDNACNSQTWKFPQGSNKTTYFKYWDEGWKLNREINYILDVVPTLKVLSDTEKKNIIGEAHFLRAFTYFEMAKRYGGLPIIAKYVKYTPGLDTLTLKVQRSTEEETFDFILADCDTAMSMLPETRSGADSRRITKWGAAAFKSRAALYAASIAKYNSKLAFTGTAYSKNMIGMTGCDGKYYQSCIDAASQVIKSGVYKLYKPNPSDPDEAASNIRSYFEDPSCSPEESIILRGYSGLPNSDHSADFWWGPAQTADGAPHPGRMNPTVNLVDCYENYNTPGEECPVQTRTDGAIAIEDYNSSRTNYIHHTDIKDFYKDKDARLFATVVLPNESWKGKTIVIQSGYIREDGSFEHNGANVAYTLKGKTYYTYGGPDISSYSGFQISAGGNMTRTGFSFKKFLSSGTVKNNDSYGNSSQDWAELRYAEVLLNLAEAVAEDGTDNAEIEQMATDALNATRFRAGHTTAIPLTIDNVQRERRVEFSFENKRWWDLLRLRKTHEVLDHYYAAGLEPMLDLRTDPPSYILVRKRVQNVQTYTFNNTQYYQSIPNTASNGCVQNPNY